MANTAKVILLRGDKSHPESAEHIIKFPGGSISVCRTSNNEYWAHVEVYQDEIIDDSVRESKNGMVVDSRMDYAYPHNQILNIPNIENLQHIAIRIKVQG